MTRIPLEDAKSTHAPLCDVSGALLKELKALKPREVLTLVDREGRKYVILNFDDIAPLITVESDD